MRISRRRFLGMSAAAAGALVTGACGELGQAGKQPINLPPMQTSAPQMRALSYNAQLVNMDLGGKQVHTWGYNGKVPGPELRIKEGDILLVRLHNSLPDDTTIHWHGLPIINSMDGVPNLTQPPVKPNQDFTYQFVVPVTGTYWYHSHVGLQSDRGMYGPLIVEPANESTSYDREYTLMLDDWLDDVSDTPDDVFRMLKGDAEGGTRMGGTPMKGMGDHQGMMMSDDAFGDIEYPYYLINGKGPESPSVFSVRKGDKVRLRLINAGADTIFRVAVDGHKLQVTHADGTSVNPVEVDTVRLGMGERYDVLIEANNPGNWQIAAQPEGKKGIARALLRYKGSDASPQPSPELLPSQLKGKLLDYGMLEVEQYNSLSAQPDKVFKLTLSGDMRKYVWSINGEEYPDAKPLRIQKNQHVRFEINNMSRMWHPMHLHGHTFQVRTDTGNGPFKDTVLVEPMGRLSFDFIANNPGKWLFHCHNAYHLEAGMARVIEYVPDKHPGLIHE